MRIESFKSEHLERADALVRENYERARESCPALPAAEIPSLQEFAENGLGAAALEGDRLLGFLGVRSPWESPWGIRGIRAVFSPLHAHAAVPEGRGILYDRLYQAAAPFWVRAGAVSHAVSLYAHEEDSQRSFVWNGFGMRCVDSVCRLSSHEDIPHGDFRELSREQWRLLLPLAAGLWTHLSAAPCFLCPDPKRRGYTEEEFLQDQEPDARFFAAMDGEKAAAYLKLSFEEAETFVSAAACMPNIKGAFCRPEYRRSGITRDLLFFVKERLWEEGYTHLGVDFESINPCGRGFWHKHFIDYTHSYVRRVDETATYTDESGRCR